MFKIAICEDDHADIMCLQEMLEQCGEKRGAEYHIDTYQTGKELVSASEAYDVLFLDIDLPDINGIELATVIREKDVVVSIIYLTNYSDLHRFVLPVHPFAYLTKPISEDKLEKTMDDLEQYNRRLEKSKNIPTIYFNTMQGAVKLSVDEICYFEYMSKKVKIVTNEGEFFLKSSIREVYEQVEKYEFAYLHRAFIINMWRVRRVLSKDVKMDDGSIIPIAQRRYSEFKGQFNDFLQKFIK